MPDRRCGHAVFGGRWLATRRALPERRCSSISRGWPSLEAGGLTRGRPKLAKDETEIERRGVSARAATLAERDPSTSRSISGRLVGECQSACRGSPGRNTFLAVQALSWSTGLLMMFVNTWSRLRVICLQDDGAWDRTQGAARGKRHKQPRASEAVKHKGRARPLGGFGRQKEAHGPGTSFPMGRAPRFARSLSQAGQRQCDMMTTERSTVRVVASS